MHVKHLVIGNGEVGSAIVNILNCLAHDPTQHLYFTGSCDYLHVCFPYFEGFIDEVNKYRQQYEAKHVVIHSTVPVGTSRELNAIHSPIRGVHPNLEEGIRTFVKYFAGEHAEEAAKEFENLGIRTKVFDNPNNTEAGKLWSTTQYGAMIMLNKEIYNWCIENNCDFDVVYSEFNKTYNEGYKLLGREDVVRPVLKYMDGKIGGHCVGANVKLFQSKTAKEIDKYQQEIV